MRLRPYRTSIILAVTFTLVLSTFWFLPQLAFIVNVNEKVSHVTMNF